MSLRLVHGRRVLLLLLALSAGHPADANEKDAAAAWISRFAFVPPVAASEGSTAASAVALPGFRVVPAAPGRQLVRVSLPMPPGVLTVASGLDVESGEQRAGADVRVLSVYPGTPSCVRRAMLTFLFDFPDAAERAFTLSRAERAATTPPAIQTGPWRGTMGPWDLVVDAEGVKALRGTEVLWAARLQAPVRAWNSPPAAEVIEHGQHYVWIRLFVPDKIWPRIIEVRADALGSVAVKVHLQRMQDGDGVAPDLGWTIASPPLTLDGKGEGRHAFLDGTSVVLDGGALTLQFPDAALLKRGELLLAPGPEGKGSQVTYWRCRESEKVPHQEAAWRTAAFVASPSGSAPLTALLEPSHRVSIGAATFEPLYKVGRPADVHGDALLTELSQFHRDAIAGSTLPGDDFGNVTGMPKSGPFGMNRLNHAPAIFEEYARSGDARLREVALLWCANFFDLSVWWGTDREGEFGGTRYNNVRASTKEHLDDDTFMWRSNDAVHFCTKGYDSFFYAYEETGDPRMATALHWQVEYASRKVHTDQGECRNIGDVMDFVRLYEFTGRPTCLENALRLFRELRTKLSDGDLFSQGGQPLDPDPPFIDEDDRGYKHPFAKPYIIGYALQGLPALARYAPDEPKLREVIRAVADFLASAQDPVGGWRYPHPKSSRMIIDQGMEHAVQLCRAAEWLEQRGEAIDNLLDAVERALQARVNGFARSGTFLSGLNGWESSTGLIKDAASIYDLYKRPDDRDPRRDYAEGAVGQGGASPEGAVHFFEAFDFYLRHRPADRLSAMTPELKQVVERMTPRAGASSEAEGELPGYGMEKKLPAFAEARIKRMAFPLAYDPARDADFPAWRSKAREKLLECLLTPPPPADFQPVAFAEEDRGTYVARKLAISISQDCRVPAYLLVPKGRGPFPAVIALHDHGAHFSIGKEKVIRPFGVDRAVSDDAQKWVDQCYGGRFIGDALAERGCVVFSMDALFWGERGRREGVEYEAQQELAANLLQLGMTWCGVITWDDIRSAEFVAALPEVDSKRMGAVGLSMGAHRTWMLAAASDRIAAGAAICWMGTTEALMAPGNNQTKGQSSFSMIVPNLRNYLDYPDVAAIACPKPMLFYNGEQDGLFPVPGVKAAYERMRRVWESQHAGDRLVTELWNVPHVFNQEMQDKAFAWLERQLRATPSQ